MFAARTPPHLATLVLLTASSMLTLNMFLPALPAMTLDLQTRAGVMALAVSGYMLLSAVLQLVMGPISDRLGRRPVLLVALSVYTVASLGCTLASDIRLFLAFRVLQSVVIAASILSSAIVRDLYPPREAASRMGTISAAMALAPMLGPMLGGFLETAVGWRAIFVLYTALGALALALVWVDLGETRTPGRHRARAADYRALLSAPAFWAYALCAGFSVGAFFIFISGIPYIASHVFGLSAALTGLGLGSITGGYMLGATVTSRLVSRFGIARFLLAGRLTPTLSLSVGLVLVLAGAVHPLVLFGTTLFVGFGNGLTIPNANAGALSVHPDLAGTAAGLNGALSVTVGAGLTWLTALVIETAGTPQALLAMMLVCVLISLAAALVANRLDRSEA
ncbi:MAG: multidrug effflux MFS transporter [Rhodobacteraceae bacterium]|nr:multidrug effflux MFS transporter [Paracoccaceae bacterium]